MFYLTFLVSPPQKRGICIFIDNLRLLETENRKIYQELTVEYGTPFSYFWKCLLPSGNSADRLQESNSISCSWCNFLRVLNRGNYSNRVSSLCTITQIAYYLPFVCVWSVNGEKPGLSIPTLGTFFHEYKVRIRVSALTLGNKLWLPWSLNFISHCCSRGWRILCHFPVNINYDKCPSTGQLMTHDQYL